MPNFITNIAHFIFEKNLPLEKLTIILPSQRAKKYLQRELFRVFKKPVFSPEIKTMNRWIQELSPVPILENTRAIFKLYTIHLKIEKEDPQTFDEFLKWGKTLLSDFDELDRYLIDSKDLFRNLTDIKEIENWSFNSKEELSEGQKRFMRFWDLLQEYYAEWNQQLVEDGECYMGKAYKTIANNIDLVYKEKKEMHFIFAGFNALSPAETSIIKQLHTMGKADVFIDADEYYLHNKHHEAGEFLRDLQKSLQVKNLPFVGKNIQKEKKNFTVINCAQPTGQAKVSASILREEIPQEELSQTAVILADERMIVPVMKNIPKNVGKANITLGLPLQNTALKSWVDLLFTVQEHSQHFQNKQIYHKDFVRFIKHPFILGFCNPQEMRAINHIEFRLLKENWVFIFPDSLEISQRIKDLISLFFTPWDIKKKEALQHIKKLNLSLFEGLDNEKNAIERSIIYHFDQSIKQLMETLEEFQPDLQLGTFRTLFNQHWIKESIAYYGHPLEGLQVMGLLETRMLDFKNLLIIGLNEGSLPPTNPIQTLIPMDLRKYHGLPTPREKQGLFAHHFYRLLHRVENSWITYSSASGDMGGIDEPSRYILQLELELAKINKNIQYKTYDYTISNKEEETAAVSLPKTKAVRERLDAYFKHKTSASALKTALRCPLDFYYKYLLGMGEEQEIEENMEANTFGSFIHDTLEELYGKFAQLDKKGNKNKHHPAISPVDIEEMLRQQKTLMRTHFDQFFHYDSQENIEGKNRLSLEMAQHLTERFLQKEKRDLKENKGHLFIHSLERRLEKTLQLTIQGERKEVKCIGFLDRIDDYNGKKRIIDYKTGKCEEKDVKITKIRGKNKTEEEVVEHLIGKLKKTKYVFQLLIYNMLFYEKFGFYPEKTGIISMVNLKESPLYLQNDLTSSTEELMALFEVALEKIITDLYDSKSVFEHDASSEFCDYCLQ